jgi:hypothetical protein
MSRDVDSFSTPHSPAFGLVYTRALMVIGQSRIDNISLEPPDREDQKWFLYIVQYLN